ncbi:MAG: hypothetical protein U9R27_01720 [Campylobacterota bacterium]|nr:hypothetical protein [Campylobacterota bacterium]
MNYNSSDRSQKDRFVLLILWGSMFMTLFIYIFICYIIKSEEMFVPMYTMEVLQDTLFMGLSIYSSIYITSAILFAVGYIYFDKSYNKLVEDTKDQSFESEEEKSKSFKTRYTTIMFISMAIFESIVIIGMVVFLQTLDFDTFLILSALSASGFLLVIPTRSKFDYRG